MVPRLKRRCNRTAPFMAQNHEQLGVEVNARIFDAAYHVVSHDIAGNTNHKKVAETLIEDEFDGNTGVAATQNGSKRMLTGFELES